MGLLIDGKWVDQWYDTHSTGGKFVRSESQFRDTLGSAKFPAEKGRYHLYISMACPWANRTSIFRKLKENLPNLSVNKNLERFINYKRLISLILVPVLTTLCLISFFDWFNGVFSNEPFNDNLNYLFFVDFFTILILVDVFILLISFQYTERYSQLIRNTGFIISTILLRLSFSATGLVSIILLVSGIIFGIIILAIYNQMEKQSIKV